MTWEWVVLTAVIWIPLVTVVEWHLTRRQDIKVLQLNHQHRIECAAVAALQTDAEQPTPPAPVAPESPPPRIQYRTC